MTFSFLSWANQFLFHAVNTSCVSLQLQLLLYWMIDTLHDMFVLTPTLNIPRRHCKCVWVATFLIPDPDFCFQVWLISLGSCFPALMEKEEMNYKSGNIRNPRTWYGGHNVNTGASSSTNLCGSTSNQSGSTPCKFSSDGEQSPKRGLNMNEGETRRQMPNCSCI